MATVLLGSHCRLTYSVSQSVDTNKSTIRVTKIEVQSDLYTGPARVGGTITIGGTVVVDLGASSNHIVQLSSSWVELPNVNATYCPTFNTKTISHDSDGTKKVAFASAISLTSNSSGSSYGSASGSANVTLPTIPRTSTISASGGTLGAALAISISRNSSSFTDTITYSCGSASGTIVSKTSSKSVSWTPPTSLANQSSGTTVSITLTVTTYSGSTKVGSKSISIKCSIPVATISAAAVTLGNAMSVTLGGTATNLQHAITWACGSQSGTVKAQSTSTTASWTPATSLAGLVSNSATVPITLTVTTYNGSTRIGTRSITVNCPIPVGGISAGSATLGAPLAITLTGVTNNITNAVSWACGARSGTVTAATASRSVSWTPELELAQQAPDAPTAAIVLTVTTYNGSAVIGTRTITVQAAIPADIVPVITSVTLADTAGFADIYGGYIVERSTLRVVTQAAGAMGSTIEAINVEFDEDYDTGADVEFPVWSAGDLTVKVTVTDSRSRTATSTSRLTALEYGMPYAQIISAYRCDDTGEDKPDGDHVALILAGEVTSLNGQNSASYYVRYYEKLHPQQVTTLQLPQLDDVYSFDGRRIVIPEMDTDLAYEFQAVATDNFGSTPSLIESVAIAFAFLDADQAARSIGLGMFAQTPDGIDIGLDTYLHDHRLTGLAEPEEAQDAVTWGSILTTLSPERLTKTGISIAAGARVEVELLFDGEYIYPPIVTVGNYQSGYAVIPVIGRVRTDGVVVELYNLSGLAATNRGVEVLAYGIKAERVVVNDND